MATHHISVAPRDSVPLQDLERCSSGFTRALSFLRRTHSSDGSFVQQLHHPAATKDVLWPATEEKAAAGGSSKRDSQQPPAGLVAATPQRTAEPLEVEIDAVAEAEKEYTSRASRLPHKKKRRSVEVLTPTTTDTTNVTTPSSASPAVAPQHPPTKRLFKSFEDMVNFDTELKHQTPIHSYEMSFVDEMEAHEATDTRWECTVNKPDVQVYKFKSENDSAVLIKAYANFNNVPVGIVGHHIRHVATRLKWDSTFADFIIVEKDIDGCEMIYCTLKAPWPIAARDFLQWRRTEYDPESNVCKIMMRSGSHPSIPEKTNFVRAETIILGYVIRPAAEDPLQSSRLFILAQTDVKGLTPKWMVNSAAEKQPTMWVEALRKACVAYVKKHGRTTPVYCADSKA